MCPIQVIAGNSDWAGSQFSYLLKPLVQDGKIHTDTTEGMKRLKYFVAA